jgi:hypothetical protein
MVIPMMRMFVLALAMVVATCSATAQAAEIVLFPSAVDAALKRELFNSNGKFVVAGDPRSCAFTTLEQPATSFREGRLFLRSYLVTRAGLPSGSQCVGGGDAFWVTVSAEPFVARDILGLRAARTEDAPLHYRALVEIFLRAFAPQALNINLRDELTKVLRDPRVGYQVSVPTIDVQSIVARDNALTVRFDFRLEAR